MNNPDSNPLGDNWEPDKNSNDPTGKSKWYKNKFTGERARWDSPTQDQEGHWHRINPDPKGQFKYLNPDGKSVKPDKPGSHIYPNPKLVIIPIQVA